MIVVIVAVMAARLAEGLQTHHRLDAADDHFLEFRSTGKRSTGRERAADVPQGGHPRPPAIAVLAPSDRVKFRETRGTRAFRRQGVFANDPEKTHFRRD